MPQPTGSWKTSSGLLDDFDFSTEEAWYGTAEKFGDQVLLHLRGVAEQEVDGEMQVVDEEHTLLYSLGDGWEAANGGRSASHTAGKTTFNNNTNMGRFINALVDLGDEAIAELQARGETYEADTWEGLKLHIERKQFSYTDRNTKEKVEYEVPLPVDFLGVVEVEEKAPAKKPATKTKATPKVKAAPEPEPAEEEEAEAPATKTKATPKPRAKKGNAELRAAVVAMGAEYAFDSHSDFVEFIFDSATFDQAEALQADEELSAEALDEDSKLWEEVSNAE